MPGEGTFRLSIYLTLALACVSLGFAEYALLPEAGVVAAAVVIALGVLYRLESRVELLSIPAANRLGLLVGLVNLVWAASRMLREINDPQMPNTDWPVLGLALFGPLVMTLMPAKLARRQKHAGDFWWLYGLALATVALAGAMADEPLAFFLIGLYSICAIWSLSLFYLLRAGESVRPVPGQSTEPARTIVLSSSPPRLGFVAALGFAVVAVAVATPIYLVTPRSSFARLEFGKPRIEIGYSADQMIDLTQTGNLEANRDAAFEVSASSPLGPMSELSLDQRWKGRVMRSYRAGVWKEGDFRMPTLHPGTRHVSEWSPPVLGPNTCSLTFSLPDGTPDRFLADPVFWNANEAAPVATITANGFQPWIWTGNGSFLSDARARNLMAPIHYVQSWCPELEPDLSPPFRLVDLDRVGIIRPLLEYRVPKVKEYADGVLANMVRDGRLPADYVDRVTFLPRREFHDVIGRSFSAHLATTPDLRYTTDLRRERKDIDPIEEFLFHTREGHCERFATALVLMLRSQGIPAVLVLGFKGCEAMDEPGRYVIRQEHAHAWVEALIEEYEPMPWWGYRLNSRWRTLDPTPSGGPVAADKPWSRRAGSWLRQIYTSYFVNYSSERRERALRSIAVAATSVEVLGGIFGLSMFVLVLRRRARAGRNRALTSAASWYEHLVRLLVPFGFAPRPGETPREFATRIAEVLRLQPTTILVADVPCEWTDTHYESRFGGVPPAPERLDALELRLRDLQSVLSARGVAPGGSR